MCGRFTLRTPARDVVEIFELLRKPELSPRYNIAPTQKVAVTGHQSSRRVLLRFQADRACGNQRRAGHVALGNCSSTMRSSRVIRSPMADACGAGNRRYNDWAFDFGISQVGRAGDRVGADRRHPPDYLVRSHSFLSRWFAPGAVDCQGIRRRLLGTRGAERLLPENDLALLEKATESWRNPLAIIVIHLIAAAAFGVLVLSRSQEKSQ